MSYRHSTQPNRTSNVVHRGNINSESGADFVIPATLFKICGREFLDADVAVWFLNETELRLKFQNNDDIFRLSRLRVMEMADGIHSIVGDGLRLEWKGCELFTARMMKKSKTDENGSTTGAGKHHNNMNNKSSSSFSSASKRPIASTSPLSAYDYHSERAIATNTNSLNSTTRDTNYKTYEQSQMNHSISNYNKSDDAKHKIQKQSHNQHDHTDAATTGGLGLPQAPLCTSIPSTRFSSGTPSSSGSKKMKGGCMSSYNEMNEVIELAPNVYASNGSSSNNSSSGRSGSTPTARSGSSGYGNAYEAFNYNSSTLAAFASPQLTTAVGNNTNSKSTSSSSSRVGGGGDNARRGSSGTSPLGDQPPMLSLPGTAAGTIYDSHSGKRLFSSNSVATAADGYVPSSEAHTQLKLGSLKVFGSKSNHSSSSSPASSSRMYSSSAGGGSAAGGSSATASTVSGPASNGAGGNVSGAGKSSWLTNMSLKGKKTTSTATSSSSLGVQDLTGDVDAAWDYNADIITLSSSVSSLPPPSAATLNASKRFFGASTARSLNNLSNATSTIQAVCLLPRPKCGIRNIGNSCYISSIMQALFVLEPLVSEVSHPFWTSLCAMQNQIVQFEQFSSSSSSVSANINRDLPSSPGVAAAATISTSGNKGVVLPSPGIPANSFYRGGNSYSNSSNSGSMVTTPLQSSSSSSSSKVSVLNSPCTTAEFPTHSADKQLQQHQDKSSTTSSSSKSSSTRCSSNVQGASGATAEHKYLQKSYLIAFAALLNKRNMCKITYSTTATAGSATGSNGLEAVVVSAAAAAVSSSLTAVSSSLTDAASAVVGTSASSNSNYATASCGLAALVNISTLSTAITNRDLFVPPSSSSSCVSLRNNINTSSSCVSLRNNRNDSSFSFDDVLDITALKTTLAHHAAHFYGYRQQDAHEFLSEILGGLHDEMKSRLESYVQVLAPVVVVATSANDVGSDATLASSRAEGSSMCGASASSVENVVDAHIQNDYQQYHPQQQKQEEHCSVVHSLVADQCLPVSRLFRSTVQSVFTCMSCGKSHSNTPEPYLDYSVELCSSSSSSSSSSASAGAAAAQKTEDEVTRDTAAYGLDNNHAVIDLVDDGANTTQNSTTTIITTSASSIAATISAAVAEEAGEAGTCVIEKTTTEQEVENPLYLEQLLSQFFKEEIRDLKCSACNKEATRVRAVTHMLDLPQVLVIHLKRFKRDWSSSTESTSFVKTNTPVTFPILLDLSTCASVLSPATAAASTASVVGDHDVDGSNNNGSIDESCVSSPPFVWPDSATALLESDSDHLKQFVAHITAANTDTSSSSSSGISPSPCASYMLQAVVRHLGSNHTNGHYICDVVATAEEQNVASAAAAAVSASTTAAAANIINEGSSSSAATTTTTGLKLHNEGPFWKRYNDAIGKYITQDTVLAEKSSPYILFYKRLTTASM